MKNISKFILTSLALVLLLTLSGCTSILQPKIYTSINASSFPSTEADAMSALIPFYAQFNTNWGSTNPSTGIYESSFNVAYLGYGWATSIQTDEDFDEWYSGYSTFTLGPSSYLNTNGACFYNRLSYVAKLTALISEINASHIPNKDIYIAEAKGLRAYFMYILWDLYGPLNPRLDPATVNSLEINPRLSEAAYVAAMDSDLEAAIAVLPTKYNGTTNWGRISKGVASMILLKVYMEEAGKTKDASYWTKAYAVGKSLMTMGYSLDPSYKDVFVTPQNNEVIYAVPGNTTTPQYWYSMIIPFDAKTVLGQDVTHNQNWKGSEMPWSFYDKYQPGDTRLQTIASYYINAQGDTIDRAHGLDGAIPIKYTNIVLNNYGFDLVIFQYSDVLLSMAEITNELYGPTPEAIGYLKQVTDRAHTIIPASATVSHDALSNFILDERGRELYWLPGIRRQDLIRHGTFISDAVARGLPAKPYQTLWPIPSDVIIQSNGVIIQNC